MTETIIVIEPEHKAELDHWAAALPAAVPEAGIHCFANYQDALPLAADASAIIAKAHRVEADLVAAMPNLRWIQALTTGIDHLLTLNLPPDIAVTSARGIHGPQMSELAFLYMLALTRDLARARASQAAHRWDRRSQILLLDKRILIVGVGTISEALAARCQAFGMRVAGISDSRVEAPGFDAIHPRAALTAQVAQADYIVALVPYSPATHQMIDRAVIAAMKPTAIFINIARGRVVDEEALIEALRDNRIAGAGLDVFHDEPLPETSPLWDLPNVIITPRVGGMSDIYAQQLAPLVIENIRHFLAGDLARLRNRVTL